MRTSGSVRWRVVSTFLLVFLVIVLIIGSAAYFYLRHTGSRQYREYAMDAAVFVQDTLKESDINPLPAGEEYEYNRKILRNICDALEMQYLYIYQPNEAHDSISYLYVTASDDKEDEIVRKERPRGKVIPWVLDSQEENAYAGNQNTKGRLENNRYGYVISWVFPLRNESGTVIALIGADFQMTKLMSTVMANLIALTLLLGGTLLVTMLIQLFLLQRMVFTPLIRISSYMTRFASGNHLHTDLPEMDSCNEIRNISEACIKMTNDIRNYVAELERETDERAQRRTQMEIARGIQYGMVPASLFVEKERISVSAKMRTAQEIGGDFYDCFLRTDGKLCVMIGDVSGKGIIAALFMAMTKSILHEQLNLGMDPAAALERSNQELCAQNPEMMFVTVFVLVIDVHTGEAVYANAGHNPPVLIKRGEACLMTPKAGTALGLFDDVEIENESVRIQSGESILLYTDGVTEAVNEYKKFFGVDRLIGLLADASKSELLSSGSKDNENRPAEDVVNTVLTGVDIFAQNSEQFDDITIVAVCMDEGEGQEHGAEAEDAKRKILEPVQDSFDVMKEELLSVCGAGPETRKIILASEEAFTNIVEYAEATRIQYKIEKGENCTIVTLEDDGRPFDPFEVKTEKEFDELDTGGMGLMLIQQIADDVERSRRNDVNCLRMVFQEKLCENPE